MHRLAIIAICLTVCLTLGTVPVLAEEPPKELPFEVTEPRDRCHHYTHKRQPLFGTTHLHTGLSFDASIRFVDYSIGNNPRGAYAFAKGEASMPLPGPTGAHDPLDPLRNPRIDRRLDWGAVTDHSEHFGEMGFCKELIVDAEGNPLPESLSMECRMINGWFYQPLRAPNPGLGRSLASQAFTNLTIMNDGTFSHNTRLPVCENNPEACEAAELKVWAEVQNAANNAYDQTRHCRFTSFIAYENTSTPLLNNWHRNVIFRNDRVVIKPVTAIDMAVRPNPDPQTVPINSLLARVDEEDAERVWPVPVGTVVDHPLPQPFWNKLEKDCWQGENVTEGEASRCDFITIPHNSNLGGGVEGLFPPLFLDPYNTEDAKRHALMEPLVEIYQDKGSSECRYDPRYLAGTDTVDEFCAFEILDGKTLGSASGVGASGDGSSAAPDTWGERAYVRNVWKDGIQYAADGTFDGVNPFKMGVVAASDSHTGVMGWHPENENWPGHLGIDDLYPVQRAASIQNSTGGFSVVWAEENSRDSIFEALKRKETYGTSGTRIVVRFFGGWELADDECQGDFVGRGYDLGVPMGADLPDRGTVDRPPRFVVAAWHDDHIGTKLQQIQIVKGWVDAEGDTHEKVVSVVGDPGHPLNPQQDLDAATCKPKEGRGHRRLCTTWRDPDFDPDEYAFYYARVLEEPVCRYSTLWCRERIGVDPLDLDQCRTDLAQLAASDDPQEVLRANHGAACCSNQTTTPFVQPVIQERAWTSPIWYEPEG